MKPALYSHQKEDVIMADQGRMLVEIVKKVSVFNGLSPTQIKKILAVCEPRSYAENDTVCARNTPSEAMFVLLKGELAIKKPDGSVIAVLSPVTTVGEVSLVTRQPYEVDVVATKQTSALFIARNKFDVLMRADPDMPLRIYRNIISLLASRFKNESMDSCDIEALRARNKLLEIRQRISLDLIADRGMSREEAAKNIAERLRGTMATILVVDDDELIRTTFKRALRHFNVLEASDGETALKVAREQNLDLVVTDIHMSGMDGYQLLEALRSEFPDLPVMGISGNVEAERGGTMGFDTFLDKPVKLADLLQGVRESLGEDEAETVEETAQLATRA